MQPRTKLEIRVTELSAKLRPITEKQLQWGEDNCIKKYGHRSKSVMHCLECGHSWKAEGTELFDEVLGIDCPECGRHLGKIQNYQTDCSRAQYFQVWQTVEDFQVIRTVFVKKIYRMANPTHVITSEVMQHWINQDGRVVWLSKSVQGLSLYCDQWVFRSDLSVKHRAPYTSSETRYNLHSDFVYPSRSVLPIIKRNGFTGNLCGLNAVRLFSLLLADPHVETLMKARMFNLIHTIERTNKNWHSVKICLRNGYKIKDAGIWFDYIDLLAFFGKDLHNARYVCPADLKAEHDRLVQMKRRIEDKKHAEEKRKRANEQEAKFKEMKGHLLGVSFSEGQITVKTLDSVQEYMDEGDALHHCVFTNNYFMKANSLCLSARIDQKPVETIELDLERMEVVQARGLRNDTTEYHDQIVEIVRKRIPVIARRLHRNKEKVQTA